jgi:putative acetyltransferase
MLKSIEGNFENPEVHELLSKHFVELRAASPEGSAHVLDIPGLQVSSIKFWSLWYNDRLMGCGALKFLDKNHGEFKSIRIHDEFRKKGNGINVINHLIEEAKKLSIIKLSLETGAGDFFKPARKLFYKCGFEPCKPFAHYKKDINSVYLTKILDNLKK